jgi:protocatechuate 3,4-dioxygenase, alpha subunit
MSTETLKETASQTAGPYLHIGMMPAASGIEHRRNQPGNILARDGARGERIRIEGMVLDGEGCPVKDALIEIWQADSDGKYDHPADMQGKTPDPNFTGFGRAVSDFGTGLWWFETVKPGKVPGRHTQVMAPHINVIIFARGINIGLQTRLYFDDEAEANAADPVLRLIELPPRRETLIAKREERDGQVVYRFDIRLQGEGETVFLDV